MKAILTIALLLTGCYLMAQCSGRKLTLTPNGDGGKIISGSTAASYKPGDTIVLSSHNGNWSYFYVDGLHGSATCPIIIINDDGIVNMKNGFDTHNSTYFKILGTGHDSTAKGTPYGINIDGNLGATSGVAIGVQGRSAHVEVAYINVYKKLYGAWLKQDASCVDSLNWPNWVMDDLYMHHCKFRNIGQDVIYAGNTSPDGQFNACGTARVVPMRLSNVRLLYLTIDSAARTGIQLSGAETGFNEIAYCNVQNCGYEYNAAQGNGIVLGGHSYGWVHDNYVKFTYKTGISMIGDGLAIMENNTVDSAGVLKDGHFNPGAWPDMDVDTRGRSVPSYYNIQFIIRNNKLGWCSADTAGTWNNTKDVGRIKISDAASNHAYRDDNYVYNNVKLEDNVTTPSIRIQSLVTQYHTIFQTSLNAVRASAGVDSSYALPRNAVVLMGFGLNLPGKTITNYLWSKISGPAVNTTNLNSQQVALTNLNPGTYTYRLTVTQSDNTTATDDVMITITGTLPTTNKSYFIHHKRNKIIFKQP